MLGCGDSQPEFSTNSVYIARLAQEIGEPLSEQGLKQSRQLLDQVFGTPNSPAIPASLPGNVVSIDGLRRAAGPVFSDETDTHFGLYRKHCVRCHGVSGDGRGPAAKLLSPYPRDFRLGKFKYKSTPMGTKPMRHDIARVLRRGIPGTSMPAFHLLKDDDIDALVDYVIYLTARGETERSLLAELAYEHNDVPDWLQFIGSSAVQQFAKWKVDQPADPQRSDSIPLWEPHTAVRDSGNGNDAHWNTVAALNDSIARGRELFGGQVASCFRCHGSLGEGGVLVRDYDDWTKDWTVAVGLDPEDRQSLSTYLRLGALKPTPISSRDLRHGVFRGGDLPEDIYRRIVHGIEGTPMPAAAMQPEVPGGLTTEQVWDLVNYCLSFQGHTLESGS